MPHIDTETLDSDEEDIGHDSPLAEDTVEVDEQANGDADAADHEDMTGDRGGGLDGEDEEDADEGEDEYVVEAILSHKFVAGEKEPFYKIKWEGFDKKSDQTWEPQANLFPAARQLLADYYRRIGGAPQPTAGSQGAKRKSTTLLKNSDTPEPKRSKQQRGSSADDNNDDDGDEGYIPKGKDWDKMVEKVETIQKNEKTGKLYALVRWRNEKRSKVGLDLSYQRMPQSMLKFYEAHLKFTS